MCSKIYVKRSDISMLMNLADTERIVWEWRVRERRIGSQERDAEAVQQETDWQRKDIMSELELSQFELRESHDCKA
jgi:hypothetical protein